MKIPKFWSFLDAEVARGFDEHVREQIPWYELATKAAAHVARNFLFDRARVYEIGAATGNFARELGAMIQERRIDYVAIEPSVLMFERYDGPGTPTLADARDVRFREFDVGISFLALMFVPKADRGPLLERWFAALRPGGALVVVEKFEPVAGTAGLVIHRLSIAMKRDAGVDCGSIVEKELSLAGSQMPLAECEVRLDGGRATQFFKFGDFAGWLVEKV